MGARFIGGDREQVFLMPPLVTDWVPEDHLVWTVLEVLASAARATASPGPPQQRDQAVALQVTTNWMAIYPPASGSP
jgi:hypothetical protein